MKSTRRTNSIFFVESEEEFTLCPCCGELLRYFCRVKRKLKDNDATERIYSIRVLKCDNDACPTTYHRELPNIIIPYKRYDAATIEEVISEDKYSVTAAVDESTVWRWKKWFKQNAVHIIMALLSVIVVIGDNAEPSSLTIKDRKNPITKIKEILDCEVQWFKETMRILVNASKWKFNRSAFLS